MLIRSFGWLMIGVDVSVYFILVWSTWFVAVAGFVVSWVFTLL